MLQIDESVNFCFRSRMNFSRRCYMWRRYYIHGCGCGGWRWRYTFKLNYRKSATNERSKNPKIGVNLRWLPLDRSETKKKKKRVFESLKKQGKPNYDLSQILITFIISGTGLIIPIFQNGLLVHDFEMRFLHYFKMGPLHNFKMRPQHSFTMRPLRLFKCTLLKQSLSSCSEQGSVTPPCSEVRCMDISIDTFENGWRLHLSFRCIIHVPLFFCQSR